MGHIKMRHALLQPVFKRPGIGKRGKISKNSPYQIIIAHVQFGVPRAGKRGKSAVFIDV